MEERCSKRDFNSLHPNCVTSFRTLLRILTFFALAAVLYSVSQAQTEPASQAEQSKNVGTPNPPGLTFELRTRSGQTQFHLGEMIEIEEDYSSTPAGRYFLLQGPRNVSGWAPAKLSITPSDSMIDRTHDTGFVSADRILHAQCGSGVGGGAGSGCGDCGDKYALGLKSLHFPYTLNYRLQITEPGHYVLTSRGANIVAAEDETKPISVTSTQLEIDVVRDYNWSDGELFKAVDQFEQAQGAYKTNLTDPNLLPGPDRNEKLRNIAEGMNNTVETIRFLDTEESLSQAVRLYDGSPNIGTYGNALYNAILESSHRDLAVKLLTPRMVEPDFLVSREFLDLLTAMTIQQEQPVTFAQKDWDSQRQLNPRTLETLKNYVLALGKSLPHKQPSVKDPAIKTFMDYAAEEYCTGAPLLPPELTKELVQRAQASGHPN